MEDNEAIDPINVETIGDHLARVQRPKEASNRRTPRYAQGSTSKAFKVAKSYGKSLDEECYDKDELSFISRKI
ncbi:hypothetical protein CR513_43301, partial [Mucuna pruriens]